jgi:hypothetical protein
MSRVWLDDVRPMPDNYDFHVETVEDAIDLLETYEVSHVGFDHDLGYEIEGKERTGYHLACWIEKQATQGLPRLTWSIQSDNPVGRKKIEQAMGAADRYWDAAEAMCRAHETYKIVLTKLNGDEDEAIYWFTHRHPELGDNTPMQLILNGKTAELYHFLGEFL